ncbi:MAG: septal junction protein FraD [Rhizonema sp. PD37]|nr:septal junction protein FraD [Rhizonema sp. PD37]
MNLIFKDLFGIFKVVEDIYARIRKILVPPKAYSWQTLIYLSVFSLLMSSLSLGYVKDIIALFGWLFLIAGTAWYTTDNPLVIPGTNMPVGAVITGFLISVFAFGREENVITTRTIVLWPTISAIIKAIPEFFEGSGTDSKAQLPKLEERQKIIILLASCMVISCWIQFYFVTDNWLRQYPSLLVDGDKRSAFVVRNEPIIKIPKNGVTILNKLQPQVTEQIDEQPWSQVEQWLINAPQIVSNLGRKVIQANLAQYEEKSLWRVEPRVSNVKSGYQLDLLSIWSGPSANPAGYYLRKSCRIDPIAAGTNNSTTIVKNTDRKNTIAEVECDSVIKFIKNGPPPQQ